MITRLISTLFFIIIFNSSFGQKLQFQVIEIVSLFDMTQDEASDFLADKNYSFIRSYDGESLYSKRTNLGEFKVSISFRNGKTSAFSCYEHFLVTNHIIYDLAQNDFKVFTSLNGDNEILAYPDCLYGLKNSKLGLLCTFMRPSYLRNTIILVYGLDPKNPIKGSLLAKLKNDKKQQEILVEKERQIQYQNEINERLLNNYSFRSNELINKPVVIIKDTAKFSALLFTCIYKSKYKDFLKFNEIESNEPVFGFDTTRRLKYIKYSSTNISNNCLKEFYDILELNESGKILFNKKENKVTSEISFQINYDVIQKPLVQDVRVDRRNQVETFDKEDSFTKIISDYFTDKKPEKGKYIFKAMQVRAQIRGKFYFNQGDPIKYHFNKIVDITGQRIVFE
jgi:hypothetical protein